MKTEARHLMDRHGLAAWTLSFDRAKKRAGITNFSHNAISLSAPLMAIYTPDQVRDVILHEIAHARVGAGHAHDAVWKAEARRLGAHPRASISDGPHVPAPYVGICPRGHRIERFRRPTRPFSCARCSRTFDPRFLFTWNT